MTEEQFYEDVELRIAPELKASLERHKDILKRVCYEIYEESEEYDIRDVVILNGTRPIDNLDDIDVDVLFEHQQEKLISEIRQAKYIIWVAVAWFTDPVLFEELKEKARQGVNIQVIVDDDDTNRKYGFEYEKYFESYRMPLKGYFDNEEATKSVLRVHKDGKVWLHSDDLGFLTNEGKTFHKGRAKRMLTRSGTKVWTSVIEDLVTTNPFVEKCSCVKMNDDVDREVPVIHIVLKDDNTCDKEELVAALIQEIGEKINEKSIPKYFIFRDELPYSEVNKKCDYRKLESENILDPYRYTINGNIIVQNKGMKLVREME